MRVERSVNEMNEMHEMHACYISCFQQKDFRVFRVVSSKSEIENIYFFS